MDTTKPISHRAGSLGATGMMSLYGISNDDLRLVRLLGETALPNMDDWIGKWYEWLETQPEYEQFFSDRETLDRVMGLQRDYWTEFFTADIDQEYIDRRRGVGEAHASIGLPLHTYFSGMNVFMDLFMKIIEQLLDDNQRLKNSLDLERKRNNLVFGGSHSPSRRR